MVIPVVSRSKKARGFVKLRSMLEGMKDGRWKMRDERLKTKDTGYRIQDTGCKMQEAR
jgi:hypothetical protein